ncbi:hypothetical protein M3Y99_00109900 [Aphelenchoides fujianensis]|nr:hypothetical protein M3Y99_00109900 [Aphelenchoides fujianensis]
MSEMAGSFRFLLALTILLCFSTTGALTDCSGDGTWGPWQAWSACSANSQVRYRDCNPLPAGCIASAPFVCLGNYTETGQCSANTTTTRKWGRLLRGSSCVPLPSGFTLRAFRRAVDHQLDVVVDAAVRNDASDEFLLIGGHLNVHAPHFDFDLYIDQHIDINAEHEHKYDDAQHDNNSEHNSFDNNVDVDKHFDFDNHNKHNDEHFNDHNSTVDYVHSVGIGRCLFVGSSLVDHWPFAFHHLPPALHFSAARNDRRIHRLHAARNDHRPHNCCIYRARRYHSVHFSRSNNSVHHPPSNHYFYDSPAYHRLHHSSSNHGVHHSSCHDRFYDSCGHDSVDRFDGLYGLDSSHNDHRLDEHGGCDDHHRLHDAAVHHYRIHEHDHAVDDHRFFSLASTTTSSTTSTSTTTSTTTTRPTSSTAAAVDSSTAAAVASTTVVPPSTTFFASTTSFLSTLTTRLSTLRATLPGGSNLPVTQCDYGQWGAWSSCSTPTYSATPCGMCGAQQRFRSCPTTGNCTCTGEAFEKIACGTPVCLYPAPAPCCTGFRPDGGNNQMACVNATAGR